MIIRFDRQQITKEDLKAVEEALLSDFITTGPRVEEFEKAFAAYVNTKHAVAVSSGTAALHLAALALRNKPGQKVITSPITFIASANCILYAGKEVDFVIIERPLNKGIQSFDPGIGTISRGNARCLICGQVTEAKKTRNLFNLSGIPAHFVVNKKGEFGKERTIAKAYSLLSDSVHLNKFIHRKLPKKTNSFDIDNYRMVKYVELDSTNTTYYTTNEKNRLFATQLNNNLDTMRKKEKSKFINLLIEKFPTQNNDSLIYKVVISNSNIENVGFGSKNE